MWQGTLAYPGALSGLCHRALLVLGTCQYCDLGVVCVLYCEYL
jgi:hypothetical protein